MRILVTGDRGLIGRELSVALEKMGHQVRGFDLKADTAQDLRDPIALREAVRGCDGILHLAAISRVAWGEANPELCRDVNVAGTQNLIDAIPSKSAPWVVFVSSREVYGDPDASPIQEDFPRQPLNNYGRSKARGEEIMEAFATCGGRVSVVRLSNVYGTIHDHPDRAVPSLLWRAMQGEPLRITGRDNFFDFVHVDDCVRGLIRAADKLASGVPNPPHVHLTTGVATSLGELAEAAISVVGSNSEIEVLPPRSFDVTGFCGVPERALEVLGWHAEINLEHGLRELREKLELRGAPPAEVAIPGLPRTA